MAGTDGSCKYFNYFEQKNLEIDVAVSVIRGFVWAISQGFYYAFAICKVDTLPALFATYMVSFNPCTCTYENLLTNSTCTASYNEVEELAELVADPERERPRRSFFGTMMSRGEDGEWHRMTPPPDPTEEDLDLAKGMSHDLHHVADCLIDTFVLDYFREDGLSWRGCTKQVESSLPIHRVA
jgi:hypothetical protein